MPDTTIIDRCEAAGLRMTGQRRTIACVLQAADDHPDVGGGRARYEEADRDHHDHLIDLETGRVIEFVDPEIEALQEKIARRLGYRLKGHKLELYGVKEK